MMLRCSPGRHLGQLDVALDVSRTCERPLSTVLQVSDAQDRHHERSGMSAFRPGHQHLNWVALLAVPSLLAFVIGSPIPHLLLGPGASSSAKAHVGVLAESIATGAWVAWGAGLAAQVRRCRRVTRAHQIGVKPSGQRVERAGDYGTLQRYLENYQADESVIPTKDPQRRQMGGLLDDPTSHGLRVSSLD